MAVRRKKDSKSKSGSKESTSQPPPKTRKKNFKAHHQKAYRKRHLSLAGIFTLAAFITLTIIIYIGLANSAVAKSARNLLKDSFASSIINQETTSQISKINSDYGFSLSYNNQEFYAGALDSNQLYIGDELNTKRPYDALRVSPTSLNSASANPALPSLSLQYHSESATKNPLDLAATESALIAKENPNFKLKATNLEQISGQEFRVTDWEIQRNEDKILSSLQASLRSYLTIYKNRALVITVNNGFSSTNLQNLDEVARSIRFDSDQNSSESSKLNGASESETSSDLNLLDRLTFTAQASAAKPSAPSSAEKASMLYSPAVVRIYNFFCMDITKNGEAYLSNLCNASAGSGFFVGSEGYIATNGHVVVNEPLDLAILNALELYAAGDSSYLEDLIMLSGLQEADLLGAKDNQEKSKIIFKALYAIPKTIFGSTNSRTNLIAALNEKQPNIEELQKVTEARKDYPESPGLKKLELKASDYRAIDGFYTGAFETSDVALVKLNGQDFPAVKLGNIQDLAQGGDINILGFPGAANSNGLVSQDENRPTLTSGKVSAIKSASGSKNQLIETDATIGHGNSGGPAFNSNEEVVGIATYTIDGAGRGDGTFNYIRDIADLTTLATNSSIDLTGVSRVQAEWQRGVELFYEGRYTKAVESFRIVKDLYPEHPKVAQLITLAETRIKAGEEVKDFPWLLLSLATVFSLGMILSLILIIRHNSKHRAYLKSLQLNSVHPPQQNINYQTSIQPPVQPPPL